MTTKAAAERYLADHLSEWGDQKYAIYNPDDRPVEELPVIYGFNLGQRSRGYPHRGRLIAQDGTPLGRHNCSSEGYMRHDLGMLEGSRPDLHETFREHHPDGYRMDFVPLAEVEAGSHDGLKAAMDRMENS